MDHLISIAIVILILSLITEKVTTFIKLYFPRLRDKRITSIGEKDREREITILSLFIGCIVAYLLKADIITILKNPLAQDVIGWKITASEISQYLSGKDYWWNALRALPGCFLTGIILSLGSKFWQELLDLLLQSRKLKESIKDEKLVQLSDSQVILQRITNGTGSVIEQALKEHKQDLLAKENVVAVGIGRKETSGSITDIGSIVVHVAKKLTDNTSVKELSQNGDMIPEYIFYQDTSGSGYKIPVDVIEVGDIKTAATVQPGGGISNQTPDYGMGTFGCVVRRETTGQALILTCYHVVKTRSHQWDWFSPHNQETVVELQNGSAQNLGTIIYGQRNQYFDVALILPNAHITLNPQILGLNTIPKGIRAVTWNDVFQQVTIQHHGATSRTKNGVIINMSITATFSYPDGKNHTLKDLICIGTRSNDTWQSISQPGDSGAIVLDANGYAIGMIVGGGANTSYAIPLSSMLNFIGVQI